MSAFVNKLFHGERYREVTEQYEHALYRYNAGVSEFLRQKKIDSGKISYEIKEIIVDNLELVKQFNSVYQTSDDLRRAFPRGYSSFIDGKSQAETKSYGYRCLVVENAEEIKRRESIIDHFNDVVIMYPHAVDLLFGGNKDIPTMEQAIASMTGLQALEDKYDAFISKSEKYPLTSFKLKQSLSLEEAVDKIVSSGHEALAATEDYLHELPSYSQMIIDKVNSSVDLLDFSPEGTKNKVQAIKHLSIEDRFSKFSDSSRTALIILYHKEPESFSYQEKADAINSCQRVELYRIGCDGLGKDSSGSRYLASIVKSSLEGKDHPFEELENANELISYRRYVEEEDDIFWDLFGLHDYSYDDYSEESLHKFEELCCFKDYVNQEFYDSGVQATIALPVDDTQKRMVLDSKSYGKLDGFTEDYKLSSFYELQDKLVSNGHTFDEACAFIRKNIKAVKAFNESIGFEPVHYTDDYDRYAINDKAFLDFIKRYSLSAGLKEKALDLRKRFSFGFDEYLRLHHIPSIDSADDATLSKIVSDIEEIKRINVIAKASNIVREFPSQVEAVLGFSYRVGAIDYQKALTICRHEAEIRDYFDLPF